MTATENSIVDLKKTFNKLLDVYKTSHASFKLNLWDKKILKIFAILGNFAKGNVNNLHASHKNIPNIRTCCT